MSFDEYKSIYEIYVPKDDGARAIIALKKEATTFDSSLLIYEVAKSLNDLNKKNI